MKKTIKVKREEADVRIDKLLASKLKGMTRQYLQKLIDEGEVRVGGKTVKASLKVKEGEKIEVSVPAPKSLNLKPLKFDLDVVYEDRNLIVINKPAGMVVHPGQGDTHTEDSLVNALLAHCKGSLSGIGGVMRPGIVHRLDKDTSGLIVVAKNDKTHQYLAGLFKERKIKKTYYALVAGHLNPMLGTIDSPIGRSHGDRKRMAVTSADEGKAAVTKYKVLEYLDECTLLEVDLLTGRTHQIRVHLSAIGHPLVGDTVYGRLQVNKKFEQEYGLERLFLHAGVLELSLSPKSKTRLFRAPLPPALEKPLKMIRRKKT
jgi:23S rRNA pseudouridine1911/1915/1917 synthase